MSRSFKETLRDELDYQGLTVKELAAKAGLVKGSIDSYLGTRQSIPTADIAVKIAQALNVTVEYLVTGENQVVEKQIPNYARYKKLLKRLDSLSAAEYENVEPFLFAAINAEKERSVVKTAKTG